MSRNFYINPFSIKKSNLVRGVAIKGDARFFSYSSKFQQ